MDPYGSVWVRMGPEYVKENYLSDIFLSGPVLNGSGLPRMVGIGPDGTGWVRMGPDGSEWVRMGPNDSEWVRMGPDGSRNGFKKII